uniref:Bcl-2 Bcl-2 homology region 1-3 domain-containing protein n=1 Tax=Setaria digitata TaxID=48799 RepID=A0A915PRT1_9BILA
MCVSGPVALKYDKYDERSSECSDFQEEIYCVQDFVADYIQYRLHIHGIRRIPDLIHPCRQDHHNDLIRAVALIFEEKHEEELRKMIVERFVCIYNETPAQMSYGRLIALIAFAGLIATRLSDMKRFEEVSLVMSYTSNFLHKRVTLTWPQDKRSWITFFDLARTIIKLNRKEKSEPKIEKREWRSAISRLAFFGSLFFRLGTVKSIEENANRLLKR